MKRRGNKSNKVPNVKLRPAQEGAVARLQRRDSSVCWAEDSQLGSDDTTIFDTCPRPFKGVVLCATGVIDKPTLFKQALELGATSTSAFTDRVTHLVAVEHGGAKYNCALERKIPILQPSWVTECYQVWLRGDDVEMLESVERHRLPIFSDVVLCPSGITDITRRTQINKILTQKGGVYLKNLERPVKVTHLLCSGDEETDKMRYAEKFNERGEAHVHLVWEEWFWDSLEFGGRFNEKKYQVRHPRPERRSLPETASSPPPSSAVADDHEAPTGAKSDDSPLDETEEELAAVRRLPTATLQLWGSLLGRRGYEISDGELVKSPSKAPRPAVLLPPASPDRGNESLISKFRRTNSFAPVRSDASTSGVPQPFRRARTTSGMNSNGDTGGSFMASAQPQRESHAESSKSAMGGSGIFSGLKFASLGEARSASVRGAIEENGGRMMLDMEDEDVDFIIVRLVSGSKMYRDEAEESLRKKYRTECWLERCVFEDRVCSPDEHITFSPLGIHPPIPGAEKVNLSFSGLDQAEAMWITRLLRVLGINLEQFFSRRSTHLLCPSATGPKFDKACQWGVPVVTMEWLVTIASTGKIPPAPDFLVPRFKQHVEREKTEELMDVDIKGKGKAVDKGKGKILVEDSVTETMSTDVRDDPPFPTQSPEEQGPIRRQLTASPQRTPLKVVPFGPATGPLATSTLKNRPYPETPTRNKSHSAFGKPAALLAGTSDLHRLATTPTRTKSTPAIRSTPPHRPTQPKAPSAPPARKPTQREIEREKKQTRIPSSRSPSPLKVPRRVQERIPTESPTRPPMDMARALELKDSITALLNKRPLPEEEAAMNNTRPGKRQRPQRPARVSRQASEARLPDAPPIPMPTYDDSMNPFEPPDELNLLDDHTVEHSIRVTYEDPKQQEETKRLMNLLNVGPKVDAAGPSDVESKGGPKGSLRTRKSARIAGF